MRRGKIIRCKYHRAEKRSPLFLRNSLSRRGQFQPASLPLKFKKSVFTNRKPQKTTNFLVSRTVPENAKGSSVVAKSYASAKNQRALRFKKIQTKVAYCQNKPKWEPMAFLYLCKLRKCLSSAGFEPPCSLTLTFRRSGLQPGT